MCEPEAREVHETEWCMRHATRLDEANVPRFISETVIVQKVLSTGQLPRLGASEWACWACALDESQFQDALREAAVLEAEADRNGGTFTSEKIAIHKGAEYALPTDKESSQK